ncbi:quinate permease [Niveomyces insectorum RCEF 264]|uniref:Quinate permease n=1 Tax=Niveomyces insectorum RCEF 264 TaxID=1081102 RepID=A0A167WGN1_9HYPO|nr:quinate permease [Niveomyces insectorum RCEF 264]
MGGGTSLWASPEWRTDPREIFNWRLFYMATTVAFAGCSYGFDQGNIGGVMTLASFQHAFGIDKDTTAAANAKEGNIAAMMAAGGSGGALLAAPCADYLGRKNSMLLYAAVFIVGCVMQEFANLGVFYAGRLISGISIGATSMLAPQFLAENSPKSVRGALTTSYNLCIILALSLAFWTNYGVSLWSKSSNLQWKLALGIQIIPGGFMFIMLFFVLETPRALVIRGKKEQALKNLCKLRNLPSDHPYVHQEFMEVCVQVDAEQELNKGVNYWQVLKDIATIRSNTRRFFLAVILFVFHKFTGTDSLNYFAPEIFEMVGVHSENSLNLMTTGIYGIVKLVTTIFYVAYMVDHIGRRRPLIVGAILQATSMLYVGLYIRFADPTTIGSGTPAGGIVGIIWLYIYAFGWSFGWSVAPYVVAAEIFPARIRSFSMSICFFVNWIVDYGITKATPDMITNMGYGIFILYAVLTYIGAVFVYFCMPELKGRSIESMDDLFQRNFWTMFRHAYPTEEEKVRRDVQEKLFHSGDGEGQGDDEKGGMAVMHHEEA